MRLQRHLLFELLAAFVLIALIVTGVLFSFMLLQFLHKATHLDMTSVLAAAPYIVPLTFPITLPLAFLVACLLTYGRFSEDNEYLAAQMGGMHPWHVVAPAALAAACLSCFVVRLNTDVIPYATLAKKEIARGQIRQILARVDDPTREDLQFNDFTMSWSGRDERGLKDVLISWTALREDGPGAPSVRVPYRARASRGRVDASRLGQDLLVLDLDDFEMQDRKGDQVTYVRETNRQVALDLDDVLGTPPSKKSKGIDEMSSSQLRYRAARLDDVLAAAPGAPEGDAVAYLRKLRSEYWKRIAMGIAPLAFALVGAGLGLSGRRGTRMAAMVTAVVVALPVYYPLLLVGENLALSGKLAPALALNVCNVVLAGGGVWALSRSIR